MQKVLGALQDAQVVLVAGPVGSGKCVTGKDAVSFLSLDHFAFAFRVDEFAESHLDRTLTASNVPANAAMLGAILAAQDRKVILVKSVERLLEKTTRDALSDLMMLAADDSGLRIILTCRDYSVEQVRASFLQPSRLRHTIVRVPPLDDAELIRVEAAHMALVIPLRNPALRNVLRNPFLLDKALEIPWSCAKSVPESEREFRALFWREIVRADHRVPAGMARRGEEALQEIAARRARALSAHVVCNDLDPAVIESLRRDSLVNSPDGSLSLLATAHDVLEDWAILQWLEEQHLTGAAFKDVSVAIGVHPAVRRSYRKWVAELIDRDAPAADRLFRAAITETTSALNSATTPSCHCSKDQRHQAFWQGMRRRRSDSAALAGVVASVATAYPHASGEALLVLLSVRDYVEIDRSSAGGRIAVVGTTGNASNFPGRPRNL